MKKISFISLLLIAFSSCQVEEMLTPENGKTPESEAKMTTYYVGIDNSGETRTSLSEEGEILWSEGDRMNIFFGVNNDNKDKLVLVEGAGTKNGSFYGPYVATSDLSQLHQTVIVYPFDENTTCVANEDKTEYTVGLTIPAVQEYTEGTFAVGSYPMIGVTEGVKEVVIETKNVISGMKLSLTGDKTIAKIVISAEGLALAGPANIVASYGNAPVTTVVDDTASNTVELECGGGVQLNETTPTDFYITLAPCEGKINVKIYDNEGGYMSRTTSSMNFGVNQIFNMPTLTYAADHKIEDDIAKAFQTGGEYKLPLSVAVHPLKENVREHYVLKGGKSLHIDLCGHTLTLLNGPGGSKACIQNENASLHISNGEIISKSSSFVFGTKNFDPNAVFELTDVNVTSTDSNGGTIMAITNATNIIFNNVNAYPKSVDLFRYRDSSYNQGSVEGDYPGESGITINGGTYKVKAGQKIFNKLAEYKLPVVFQGDCLFSENSYTGVTWAESGNEEFPWKPVGHKVFVGSQGFYSLAEAVASVEESATVTVAADLELTETVTIPAGKSIVLDLAGNTISQSKECTGSYEMIKNNGTLTITGEGTLRFEDLSDGGSAAWGTYIITNNGTLVVENGTLEHLGTSDLSNHDTCIPIQNYAGKVTVHDGVISSPEFRSLRDFTAGGEIEINGGVFKGQVWMQGLGNGSSSLTIKGGEFAPTAGYDGSSIYITNNTNDVKVSIEGGKFNTKIGCADATKAGVAGCITGGLFTESAKDNTNAGLLKSGLAFVESGDVDFPYSLDYRIFANGVGYPSIQAAIDASVGGETIEVAAGTYPQVLKVTGGKNFTIQPKEANTVVTIGGVDHQSNGTASTVVFNNITFDNSIQTAGWFTGTAQNLNVCVGAWGGDLSFNGCTFNVAGTSRAETGVMTWWTTDKMSLSFKGCTFNGINDHASARAMQIYGNVVLTVDGCTFNTHKDYSLKYVGAEGTTAVLTNNIVNNTENFVELGSSVYPGNAYIVTITGSTLGEGINDYIVANVEEQIVNGVEYSKYLVSANGQKFETVDAALAGTTGDVEITLKNGTFTLPGFSGRNVSIVGEDKANVLLNMPKSIYLQGASLSLKNLTYSIPTGLAYSEQAFAFIHHAEELNITDCIINNGLRINTSKTVIDNCDFNVYTASGFDGYALYYYGNDKSECHVSNSRVNSVSKGFVVYSESKKEYNLIVEDCTFTASTKADKAAIQMHTEYGVYGTLTVNRTTATGFADINGGLWNELMNNGSGTLTDNFVKMIDGVEVSNSVATVGGVSYTSLAEALKAAEAGQTVAVKAGQYTALPQVNDGVIIECEEGTVFAGRSSVSGENVTIKNATFVNTTDVIDNEYRAITGSLKNATFVGCDFDSRHGARYLYAYGDVAFTDCTFGNETCVRGVHFDNGDGTVTFNNCTLYGFQALGTSLSKVTFNDCTFAYNNNKNVVNMYNQYEYNRCKFNTSMNTDCCSNTSVNASYNSCTYLDGTAIDFSNFVRFDNDVAKNNAVIYVDGKYMVSSAASLQKVLDNATSDVEVFFSQDIVGNVKVTQKQGVNVVIDGQNKKFTGILTTFGNGRQSSAETLTVKNIDFVAATGADSCIISPDRAVNNLYSYSHNVTIEGCTFTDPDGDVNCAAVRHGDGGDKNWTVKDCMVDNTMHSIFQVNNVADKLTIDGCKVLSKNGANLNSCTNVEMTDCNFDVKGYAVRFGVASGGNLGEVKTYTFKDSYLKSACDDGDAVIIFRASAVDATLTLVNTTLDGTTEFSGNTDATTIFR